MDMRRNWLFLLGWMVLLPTLSACRQTTGTTSLTPIGNIGPLAPVSGGTAAASLSPLGQPTRVRTASRPALIALRITTWGVPHRPAKSTTEPRLTIRSPAPRRVRGQIGSGVAPTAYTRTIKQTMVTRRSRVPAPPNRPCHPPAEACV